MGIAEGEPFALLNSTPPLNGTPQPGPTFLCVNVSARLSTVALPCYADLLPQVEATVDFPHKQGFLKKTSSGSSTFGLKSIKKRWFRLEAGELRYYEDEDVRASKLKGARSPSCSFCPDPNGAGVLQLQGAKVATGDGSQSGMINLFLSAGKRDVPLSRLECVFSRLPGVNVNARLHPLNSTLCSDSLHRS